MELMGVGLEPIRLSVVWPRGIHERPRLFDGQQRPNQGLRVQIIW